MKITGIELNNFQRHKKLVVQFSPGITTILGETDVGKSSLLRALRWACQNVPSGDEFVRRGADGVEVRLAIAEKGGKLTIIRSKKNRENYYQLECRGDGGKVLAKHYRAFGANVPEDIAKALQLDDINFQGQHDAPFWFSESAAEVSRRLNAVIDLSIIDEALSRVAATVRQANERKSVSEERLRELRQEEETLKPQRARVQEFETLYEKHAQKQKAMESANRLESRILLYGRHQETLRNASAQATDAESLLASAATARRLGRQRDQLGDLLARVEKAHAVPVPPDISALDAAYSAWDKAKRQVREFKTLMQAVAEALEEAEVAAGEAAVAEEKFHKKIKGQRCFICGGYLSELECKRRKAL